MHFRIPYNLVLCTLLAGAGVALQAGCGGEEEQWIKDAEDSPPGKLDGGSWPLLRRGHWNKNVVVAQYLLRHHGESGFQLNGKFGPATEQAVRRFQRASGLLDDGVIGDKTWSRLVEDARRGDSGMKVGAIQYLLHERYGYNIGVTKIYGATTEGMVSAFQKARCLGVDGMVGLKTWRTLIANISWCGAGGANTARAEALALAARQGQAGRSLGRCWQYVWDAMVRAGVATQSGGDKLAAAGPCSPGQFNNSACCFGRNAAANPDLLYQTFRMKRLSTNPRSAPRGAVIVWDRGCNGYNYTHGHIEVAQGNGTACSDFCGSIAWGGANCAWVFVPAF